jgi:molybdopterin molybdotransferase
MEKGDVVKLLTGARIPDGVEAVVMKEYAEEKDNSVLLRKSTHSGENIRRKGEEFHTGDEVLPKGTRITPSVVGVIAAMGHASFTVYRKPRVALIATGNELVEPGQPLASGQIYDSNSAALAAALKAMRIMSTSIVRLPDDLATLKIALSRALKEADVVVTIGGISVGDTDFVKEACMQLGVCTHFWRVAIKPGKPNYFGTYNDPDGAAKLVFGLPGNPVAALVSFHQFIKPALCKMMGAEDNAIRTLHAILRNDLGKKPGRLEFVRANLVPQDHTLTVMPLKGRESHLIGSIAKADCLIHFPADKSHLAKGAHVIIEFLDWNS